jgi:hypothetical protein
MADETKTPELTMPKHTSEITGTTREVLAKKAALISKFGYTEWEKLVAASSVKTKR